MIKKNEKQNKGCTDTNTDDVCGSRLVVMATDRGSPRLAGSATLTVIIVDLNDNSPTIPLPREVRVAEGRSHNTTAPEPSEGPRLGLYLLGSRTAKTKSPIHGNTLFIWGRRKQKSNMFWKNHCVALSRENDC